MRKLLNTIYVTNEQAYLSLDSENIVCKIDDEQKFRIPFDNVEAIVCFSYIGCSPALMGKCVELNIPITFLSPSGKFLASVNGGIHGNVFLRINQIDKFRESSIELIQNTVAAKLNNTITVMKRSRHDIQKLRDDEEFSDVINKLRNSIDNVYNAFDIDTIRGIEGNCASLYFSQFNKLLTTDKFSFNERTKRPPLDPVNAVLSFIYSIYTNEYAGALQTVGLDSYVGFYHALRSGRKSLACDLIEETRCICERFTITLFNLGILNQKDFDVAASGAVLLNDDGRKKVISKWQEKKRTDIVHPYLKQKIQFGLLPYVQSNLLSKYIRGDIEEYPCYLNKLG